MAFNATDPAYSAVLLNHSMALFNLASDYPGSYMNSSNPGVGELAKHWHTTLNSNCEVGRPACLHHL